MEAVFASGLLEREVVYSSDIKRLCNSKKMTDHHTMRCAYGWADKRSACWEEDLAERIKEQDRKTLRCLYHPQQSRRISLHQRKSREKRCSVQIYCGVSEEEIYRQKKGINGNIGVGVILY